MQPSLSYNPESPGWYLGMASFEPGPGGSTTPGELHPNYPPDQIVYPPGYQRRLAGGITIPGQSWPPGYPPHNGPHAYPPGHTIPGQDGKPFHVPWLSRSVAAPVVDAVARAAGRVVNSVKGALGVDDGKDGAANAPARGLMKAKFRLFNTITARKLSAGQRMAIRGHPRNVASEKIAYPALTFPPTFDPRTPDGVPADMAASRFYTDDDGVQRPAISGAMDQAGCGSCWAFAFASAATDRIRIGLLKRFGSRKACLMSSFFRLLDVCTGESGVEAAGGSGVINASATKLYGEEVRDRISPYWVVGFSPKMRDSCPISGFETCVKDSCGAALTLWQRSAQHVDAGQLHDYLGDNFASCMGCEGNHIAMPLIMMTDPQKGAAAMSQFPIQDWACLFGSPALRKIYCEADAEKHPVPKLFTADKYVYGTSDDLNGGYAPPGVHSMEDWIKAEVFNFGTVSIGFSVYQSFMDFFARQPRGIYTARDFALDRAVGLAAWDGKRPGPADPSDSSAVAEKKMKTNIAPRGGHAVDIVGWGESTSPAGQSTTLPGVPIRYWIVRNSWGPSWGDNGFFRIERNMKDGGLVGFEAELGAVYFAPDPDAAAYAGDIIANNPMADYSTTPPAAHCIGEHHHHGDVAAELKIKCSCPHGHIRLGGKCIADPDGKLEEKLLFGTANHVRALSGVADASSRKKRLVVLFILVLLAAFLLGPRAARKWREAKATAAGPAPRGTVSTAA